MDIQQLEYIVAAVQLQSYARAAEKLMVSPQAISKTVSATERQLRRKLFVRDGRGVRATPFGVMYADKAQQVIECFDGLQSFAAIPWSDTTPGGHIVIALATSSLRGEIYSPDALLKFSEHFADIRVELLRYPSDTCLEAIRCGMADASIVLGNCDESNLRTQRIRTVNLHVVLHRANPHASKAELSLCDISQMTLAYPEDIRCAQSTIESHFRDFGIPLPRFRQIAPRKQDLSDFLESNGAILCAPNNPLRTLSNDLLSLPIKKEQEILLPVYLVFKKDNESIALSCLKKYLDS